jgi:heme exporter protein C
MIQTLLSPKHFFLFSNKLRRWALGLFLFSISYGLIGALYLAPPDYLQGDTFRIIYIHVPCAFLSLLVYTIMAASAILGLIFRLKLAFVIMRESVSLGAMFTLLALITGSLWGKPMWGTWWLWDARLTSELILLFIYVGILLFQFATRHRQQSERAVAILILIGFIDIPIIHFSVYWWNTLHQGATLRFLSPSTIAPEMLHPLISMLIAFFCYYLLVLSLRINYSLIALQQQTHWLTENKIR